MIPVGSVKSAAESMALATSLDCSLHADLIQFQTILLPLDLVSQNSFFFLSNSYLDKFVENYLVLLIPTPTNLLII